MQNWSKSVIYRYLSVSVSIYLSYHSTFSEKQHFLIVHCSQTVKAICLEIVGHCNIRLEIIYSKFEIHCMIGRLKILNLKIAIFAFSYCLYIMYAGKQNLKKIKNLKTSFPNIQQLGSGRRPSPSMQPGGFAPGLQGVRSRGCACQRTDISYLTKS